jgi:hypothetical protein
MDLEQKVEPRSVLAPLGVGVGILGLAWYLAWVQPLPQSRVQPQWMQQPCASGALTGGVRPVQGGPAEKGQHVPLCPITGDRRRRSAP